MSYEGGKGVEGSVYLVDLSKLDDVIYTRYIVHYVKLCVYQSKYYLFDMANK